jgi:SAM-dependent methyltransferase
MEYRYTNRDMETVTGEPARQHLLKTNDKEFLSPERGVVAVSRERWQIAQDAESHGWMDIWRDVIEDRNHHHFVTFDYLQILNDRTFARAMELGCGPFTNMRYAAHALKPKSIELLDPLMPRYMEHQHCSYRTGRLRLFDGQMVPIAACWAMPIEDFRAEAPYDLVLLINVIEHCIDVDLIFTRVWEMLAPGGVFIFHDRYYDAAEIAATILTEYDTAHPIKADRRVIDQFLDRFKLIFSRTTTTRGRPMFTSTGDAVYFVGEKP